jgi:signal transduction histidine kinase
VADPAAQPAADPGADPWRHRLTTIRVRQTAVALLVVGVALLVGGGLVLALVRRDLVASAERQARQRAEETAALLRLGPLPAELPAGGEDRVVVQVVAAPDRVLSASADLRGQPPLLAAPAGAGPATGTVTGTVRRLLAGELTEYRVVGLRAGGAGAPMVYAASSLEPAHEAIAATATALAVAIPLLLACVGVTSWRLVGRSLRPVEAIRAQVEWITPDQLDRRVAEPPARDELGRLARTMNTMLDRLQRSHERQRRFVSDASHELRSPLAAIRTRVEVGLAHPDRTDWVALARAVHREGDRLDRLVDELLRLASASTAGAGHTAVAVVDLDEVVLDEVEALRARGAVDVDLAALSPVRLRGRPEQLRLIVRNLLDNAERHAAARVAIGLAARGDAAELVVSNDGDPVPAAERERVFDPFHRLQPARDRASGGTGLGLAIVRDAVTAHGGRVWFADCADGAEAHVRLPLTGPTPRQTPGGPGAARR